ncbi:unnamed protein product, partial [Cuscuta epithymum]
MGLERQMILLLCVLALGIATTLEEISLADERDAAGRLDREALVDHSDGGGLVELVFTHIVRARPPLEPPPYQEELCGKILFQYYFLFSSTYFYFSLSRFGTNVWIFGVLLIDRGFGSDCFRPKFA